MELNPEWTRHFVQTINDSAYYELLSIKIAELNWGQARLEIELQPKHRQAEGFVHGGVFSGLIDATGFMAVYTGLEQGLGLTTLEMKLNYLAPAVEGRLVALGRVIKRGKTISLSEVKVEDQDGRLLAHGTVTLMTLPLTSLSGQGNAPPKFLK
ncbi:MAG: PaaI family thioesterase [Pseudomonadota bacterium]